MTHLFKEIPRKISEVKGLICFSLWGTSEFYWHGACRNAIDASIFYPKWTVRFYVDDSTDERSLERLRDLGAEVQVMNTLPAPFGGLFWRFLGATSSDHDVFVCRDVDCRFSVREVSAVAEWLESGSNFHIMRDHPYHTVPILGGLWGSRTQFMRAIGFQTHLNAWGVRDKKGVDQDFLASLYPSLRADSLEHSAFIAFPKSNTRRFPTRRISNEFVGEVFDQNDMPVLKDRLLIPIR